MSEKVSYWLTGVIPAVTLFALTFFIPIDWARIALIVVGTGWIILRTALYFKKNVGAFDRLLAKRKGEQLIVLAVIVLSVLVFVLAIAAISPNPVNYGIGDPVAAHRVLSENGEPSQSVANKLIATAHRFLGLNYYPEDTDGVNFWMIIASLIGSILVEGLLITALTNSVQQRKEDVSKGLVHYKQMKDHSVVIGYGPYTTPLVLRLLREGQDQRVLLMSSQSIEMIRSEMEAELDEESMKRVFLYSGSMLSETHLQNLNIPSAKEVYLLGESAGESIGDDSIKIECAQKLKLCRWNGSGTKPAILPVHILFDKPTTYATIRGLSFPENYYCLLGETVTYLRPFNYYENCARNIWGAEKNEFQKRVPPDLDFQRLDEGSDKTVHLVIVGFNDMGRALMLEALRVCHYPNFTKKDKSNKTLITVVDPNMDEIRPAFETSYPRLDLIEDIAIEYRSARIEDLHPELEKWAGDDKQLLTVAFCFFDPDTSFAAALHLPDSLYYTDAPGGESVMTSNDHVRILINQPFTKGIADVLKNLSTTKYKNLFFFGSIHEAFARRMFDDRKPMLVNAYYSFKYYKGEKDRTGNFIQYFIDHFGLSLPKDIDFWDYARKYPERALSLARQIWIACDEDRRYANRYQIEMYETFRKYEVNDNRPKAEANKHLMKMEHRRWCAERIIVGYKPFHHIDKAGVVSPDWKAAYKRSKNEYKLHHLLIPFDLLPDNEKDKDQDVIVNREAVTDLSKQTISPELLAQYEVKVRYSPKPLDLSDIALPSELEGLVERLAENLHDIWARMRMDEGWKLGSLDERLKQHPDLRWFSELPQSTKDLDLANSLAFIKCILKAGYEIVKEKDVALRNRPQKGEKYNPQPIDVSRVCLSAELNNLVDIIAQNSHEVWAQIKLDHDWVYGPCRNEESTPRKHPDLVPFSELSATEKEYDILPTEGNLKAIEKLGYRIQKKA